MEPVEKKEVRLWRIKKSDALETRDSFKTRPGFILACIGSAVGMGGNIWLFPYRVGQFGGAAFF